MAERATRYRKDQSMKEMLTVEVPSGTRRRLEVMGFPYDRNGRDVLCFLIEQGLAVLEKHRHGPDATPKVDTRSGVGL